MNPPRLVADAWLAEKLGKPAFHLVGDLGGDSQSQAELHRQLRGRLFADAKIAVEEGAAAGAMLAMGFALIDTNLRFTMPRTAAPAWNAKVDVGFATPDMAQAVGRIAEDAFVHDRFHRDPAVGAEVARRLKGDWARNFFAGKRGDWMVVAREHDTPVGFLQLLRGPQDALIIDLIAVTGPHRRGGRAGAMIAFAAAHCSAAGPLIVGTQLANLASVRLYEGLGFRLDAAQYVFHHHGDSR